MVTSSFLYRKTLPGANSTLICIYLPFIFPFLCHLASPLHSQLTLKLSLRLILESTPDFVSTLFCMRTQGVSLDRNCSKSSELSQYVLWVPRLYIAYPYLLYSLIINHDVLHITSAASEKLTGGFRFAAMASCICKSQQTVLCLSMIFRSMVSYPKCFLTTFYMIIQCNCWFSVLEPFYANLSTD